MEANAHTPHKRIQADDQALKERLCVLVVQLRKKFENSDLGDEALTKTAREMACSQDLHDMEVNLVIELANSRVSE